MKFGPIISFGMLVLSVAGLITALVLGPWWPVAGVAAIMVVLFSWTVWTDLKARYKKP